MKSFEAFSKEMETALRRNDVAEIHRLAVEGAKNYQCPDSLYLLGAKVAKKDQKAAIVLFERALEMKQKVPHFNIMAGISWLNLEPNSGYELMDKGLKYAAQDSKTVNEDFYFFAQIFNDINQSYLAKQSLLEFLKREGDVFRGTVSLARVLENSSNKNEKIYSDAHYLYEQALKIEPHSFVGNLGKFICEYNLNNNIQMSTLGSTLSYLNKTEQDLKITKNFKIHEECEIRKFYMKDYKF